MKHSEFGKASRRHLRICIHLLHNFDNPPSGLGKEEHQNLVLLNIYYLSGYVLECMLKHLICTHANIRKMDTPLSESKKDMVGISGISYEKLQSHDLKNLSSYAQNLGVSSDKLPSKIFKEQNLSFYKNWSSEIRYSLSYAKEIKEIDITKHNISIYMKAIESLYKKVNLQ